MEKEYLHREKKTSIHPMTLVMGFLKVFIMKTEVKPKIKKIKTEKPKSYPHPNFRTLKVKAKMKKRKNKKQLKLKTIKRKKTGKSEKLDIGKLMRKYAYIEIVDTDKKMIKKEYLNISPAAVQEYISRIIDATEINMQEIAFRVQVRHNRKTIMVKHNKKDKEDIDDITEHFGYRHAKIVDGDKNEVSQ